jgi:hypothetical protein
MFVRIGIPVPVSISISISIGSGHWCTAWDENGMLRRVQQLGRDFFGTDSLGGFLFLDCGDCRCRAGGLLRLRLEVR